MMRDIEKINDVKVKFGITTHDFFARIDQLEKLVFLINKSV